MADELEVLEPTGSSVAYRDETIDVRPLTIGQIPKLVRMARPVIDEILKLENLEGLQDDDGEFVTILFDLIEKHGEAMYEAAALCIEKPVAWVAGGNVAEFVDLARKVIEVNRDFFVQKLGPLLAGRAKLNAGNGQTALSS